MDVEVDSILLAAHELKAPLAVLRQLALSLTEWTRQMNALEAKW